MIFIIPLLLFFIVFAFFLSRRLSPIPYFPSNKKDISLIVKSLKLKNDQTVYDLGAGDGVVIFAGARHAHDKKLNTKFIAVEINPFLILYMKIAALAHSNRKNISIERDDIFTMQYKNTNNITFFTYISPWFMEKVFKNISKHISRFYYVSYFYALPKTVKRKPKQIIHGVHTIYEY